MFIEQRAAPLWALLVGYVFCASFSLALFPRVGWMPSLTVCVISCLLMSWIWSQAQSSIKLDDEYLYVGRARIERLWISQVEVFDKQQFLERIRTKALRTDYLALRNLDYGGVVLHIADESDPHKHWVISMRHGAQLKDHLDRGHHV